LDDPWNASSLATLIEAPLGTIESDAFSKSCRSVSMIDSWTTGRSPVEHRPQDNGSACWADRLREPGLTSAVEVEAGPPFLGPVLGLAGASVLLVVLNSTFELKDSPWFLAGWIIFLPASLLAGAYVVRRAVAGRWTRAIGSPPPASMILSVVAERLVIWRRPRRGDDHPTRLVDEPSSGVTLRPRLMGIGGLQITLTNGASLVVNHSFGPGERASIQRILEEVDRAN
jgi:hypothetical protein